MYNLCNKIAIIYYYMLIEVSIKNNNLPCMKKDIDNLD